MAKVMTGAKFIEKLKDAANHKTLYVLGGIGFPLNARGKQRSAKNEFNRRSDRAPKISAASDDTFAMDCVGMIKTILWGWTGDPKRTYGGAAYAANGVPDIGADRMITVCTDVSTDFSKITPGEAVWMPGHIGVYIGDGLAIECTPIWKDGVQITACNRTVAGYNRRNWKKHGKLPYIDYAAAATPAVKPTPVPSKPASSAGKITVKEWQLAAIADGFKFPKYGADGAWGAECESVAKRAICQKRIRYTNKNLTKLVQRVVGTTVDGLFGNGTANAVKVWQKSHGLTADGCVGVNTWKKMLGV